MALTIKALLSHGVIVVGFGVVLGACGRDAVSVVARLEADNPLRPLSAPPLGMELYFAEAKQLPDPARVRLGRWLFYDKRLSADRTVSCATCHRPEYAFSEPTAVSTGISRRTGRRKAPSFVNLAVRPARMAPTEGDPGPTYFWDGRAQTLEDQVLAPIENIQEMGTSHAAMVRMLSGVRGYAPYFRQAFGSEDVTKERVAAAIADYERTRVSGNAPYDRWRFTRDEQAVSAEAKRGHALFFDKGRCSVCHSGSNFTDGLFYNLGVGWDPRSNTFRDQGRFLVTNNPNDRGAFKTPGLREVSRHPPYMHDGSMATLQDVVELYNRGGVKNPTITRRLTPLGLTREDVEALVAFLKTLEGEGYQDRAPRWFPE